MSANWRKTNIHPLRALRTTAEMFGVSEDIVFWPYPGRDEAYRRIREQMPTPEFLAEREMLPRLGFRMSQDDMIVPAMQAIFDAFGRRIFYEDADLHERLVQTDLKDVPTTMLALPYPAIYVAFGQQGRWKLFDAETGEHPVDGAYLYFRPVSEGGIKTHPLFVPLFEGAAHTITISITALPNENSSNLLDDANQWVSLPIREDAMVAEVVEESYRIGEEFRKQIGDRISQVHIRQNARTVRDITLHLAKFILYMNIPDVRNRMVRLDERDRHLAEAERRKGKKAEKARRKAARSFNVVRIIGPEPVGGSGVASGSGRTVRPHWRRGHFRMQPYGPGLNKRKLVWIEPVLVNRDDLGAASEPGGERYRVR